MFKVNLARSGFFWKRWARVNIVSRLSRVWGLCTASSNQGRAFRVEPEPVPALISATHPKEAKEEFWEWKNIHYSNLNEWTSSWNLTEARGRSSAAATRRKRTRCTRRWRTWTPQGGWWSRRWSETSTDSQPRSKARPGFEWRTGKIVNNRQKEAVLFYSRPGANFMRQELRGKFHPAEISLKLNWKFLHCFFDGSKFSSTSEEFTPNFFS